MRENLVIINNLSPNLCLIAQDVEKVLPELVNVNDKGFKTVSYGVELQMFTIQAIKELNMKVTNLEMENKELKSELTELKKGEDL